MLEVQCRLLYWQGFGEPSCLRLQEENNLPSGTCWNIWHRTCTV